MLFDLPTPAYHPFFVFHIHVAINPPLTPTLDRRLPAFIIHHQPLKSQLLHALEKTITNDSASSTINVKNVVAQCDLQKSQTNLLTGPPFGMRVIRTEGDVTAVGTSIVDLLHGFLDVAYRATLGTEEQLVLDDQAPDRPKMAPPLWSGRTRTGNYLNRKLSRSPPVKTERFCPFVVRKSMREPSYTRYSNS